MAEEVNIQLRFDGPELKAHMMDAKLLGPTLLAMGELCEGANETVNGARARMRVLVHADIKPNCVTIDFHLVQKLWDAANALIGNVDVASARELLELIGVLSGSAGLLKYLRLKRDRKESSSRIEQKDNGNVVIVKIEGDNNSIMLPESVYKLSRSPKVVEAVKTIAAPVNELGIDEAVFIHNKKETLTIDKSFAADLQKVVAEVETSEPQTFTAHIVTYGPVFDPNSKHWKFKLNNRIESLDISGTSIAEQALARGGVRVGDTYKVKMEMTERKTRSGDYKTEFKVKEVLEFFPGVHHQQTSLP